MSTQPSRGRARPRAARGGKRRGVKLLTLADGRHVARWVDPWSRRQQQQNLDALGLSTAEARRAWAITKAEHLNRTRAAIAAGGAEAARVTLKKSVGDYLERYANQRTQDSKKVVLRSFEAWALKLGRRDAQDLAGPLLVQWRDHVLRPKSGHKPSTANRYLTATLGFCNWLRGRGLTPFLTSDTIADALRREPEPRRELQFLRPPQLAKLLEAVLRHDAAGRDPFASFLLIVTLTGMRDAEARGLRWAEIDLGAKEIRLPAERTKTKDARTVDLSVSPSVVELLQALRLRTPGPLVFPRIARYHVTRAVEALPRDFDAPRFTLHALRRSCGSIMTCAPAIFGGASAFLSAKRLGHSVLIAEKKYVGTLQGLPATAKTIEAAAGIEVLATQVVRAAGGAVAATARASSDEKVEAAVGAE